MTIKGVLDIALIAGGVFAGLIPGFARALRKGSLLIDALAESGRALILFVFALGLMTRADMYGGILSWTAAILVVLIAIECGASARIDWELWRECRNLSVQEQAAVMKRVFDDEDRR